MAEALAVVSVVASIVQLVDFSTRVVSRLDEFCSVAKEVPKSFRHVKTELLLLTTTLEQLKDAIDTTSVADGSKKALLPVIIGCTQQVEQLEAILKKTLPENNDSWGRKGKKAVVSLHNDAKVESTTKALRNYIRILTFYYAATSSTLQPLTDAKLCKIRQWLSAPDPSTNYQKALKLRQADTGNWFLESNTYTSWKMAAASPLWLYGIPGCGKTILSSTVLENIFQNCQDDPGKAIAYFFFDFNDVQKQDPEMMIHSLVCQLSQQCIKIPASLDILFSSSESGQRQPPAHALMEALRSMMQGLPTVYVVLDALDECTQREELMEMLKAITGWQLPNLHFMVTSRRERGIEMSLEGLVDERSRICLQSTLVDKDIQQYVRQRLSDDKRLRKWAKDTSMMGQIETALMSGAKGMFRWAVCQLDALGKCVNRKMLKQALATLPPTLDQTYDRILASIDNDYSQYAFRILQWLTFAAKPLSVDEVAEVIAIDVKREPIFDCDEVLEDSLEILNICSSLVAIATENDDGWRKPREVVVLAHYSVKEYLVSERIWKGKAAVYGMRDNVCHDAIATGCLGYLLQFQQSRLEPDFLKSFKLGRYSAEFWASHTQKGGDAMKETSQKAMQLCSRENYAYTNWIRLWDPDMPWEEPKLEKNSNEIPNPLYYAALLDLRNMLKILLEKDADINAQGGYYGNALHAASYRGHEAVVKMLLDKDADVNAQGGYFGNTLHAASSGGNEAVVKMLLDKDADVNAQGGTYGHALQAASSGGHEAVVKMLLDKDADVNAQGGTFGNALHAASSGGHEAVVKMLLDKDADVNAQGGAFGNALQAASSGGNEAVVKLLLDEDADVNAQGGTFGNALQAASEGGHEAVVKMLLDKDADVNAQGGTYGHALQAASYRGHEAVVKLLLDEDADVNAQGGTFGNALQAASYRGHEAVVKMLLDKDADVNAQGGYFGNALQAASEGGHEAVVKMLLDKDADVNAQGGYFGNALQAASYRGHEAVMKMLLDKDADVNAQGGTYGHVLQAASYGGHEAVVKMLLDKDADVNAQGGTFGNALQAASSAGHETVVKLLLDEDADVNAQGGTFGNALQAASEGGREAVVKILLDKDADVNAQGGYFGNALQAASEGGHEAVVKMLLDKDADVNAQGGTFGNALEAASSGGHEAVVKMLLDKDADVNAQGGTYGHALQAASSGGHEAVVKPLVASGAKSS